MRKSMNKLIVSSVLALIAIVMMVTVSYAWYSLAGAPALEGIQITIGGTNTIKVAPNITEELEDGQVVHYPGFFAETFDVSRMDTYAYLGSLAGLTPVSTADGLHWFYLGEDADLEVNGSTTLADYQMDSVLNNANISVEEATVDGKEGSYVYLDFWVVSPTSDCNLRVSIGSENEGSYLIGLPKAKKDGSTITGYRLEEGNDEAATSVRVGFLVNDQKIEENAAMNAYIDSGYFSEKYTALKGYYQEPGESIEAEHEYQFLIYEPNSDLHNGVGTALVQTEEGLSYISCEDGDYAITSPIGYENGHAVLADVSDRLTVQKSSQWKGENGEIILSQIFQTSIVGADIEGKSESQITQYFYQDYLENNLSEYIKRAPFFQNTKMLYYSGNGVVTAPENMGYLEMTNATEKAVIVTLERNIPQRVRMFVWLEGQDVDCAREAAMESFTIGIELAGSTQG